MMQSADALLEQDLKKSGLSASDLDAYVAQEPELIAVGLKPHLYLGNGPSTKSPGYVIPYFDITGIRAPFYRVRLFHPTPKGAKYLQPSNVGTWIYFPRNFRQLLERAIKAGHQGPVIITEGEKKAAKAAQHGFLACGVGGVYNWRSKTLILPEDTTLAKNREGQIVAKIPGDTMQTPTVDRRGVLAQGLRPLIDLIRKHNLKVVIAFDSDAPPNPDVQKAAAELAFEMRFSGIPTQNIRQLELSKLTGTKVGLDDYLVDKGANALWEAMEALSKDRGGYPVHPNLRELIGRSLDGRMDRSEFKELSLMLLADMDVHGIRMLDRSTRAPFYFDARTKVLMPVNLLHHHEEPLHETRFGEFLYRQYDLSQGDSKLVTWLAAGFTGEEPVSVVDPKSVFTLTPDGLAYQVDDGHFIHITSDINHPIHLRTNGSDGILFKAGQVEPVDHISLIRRIKQEIHQIQSGMDFDQFYWADATKQFKFIHPTDAHVMTVLSYISPWLQRWRNAQLPVELMIGEPGSGKSSMYSLRLETLTGRPALRNQPTDIRDWYASITSQDGMHVTDNIGFASKEIKARLSDEMCRIVTEPRPTVEMRKLFTTSENVRIPVHIVFAMTAIQQPFTNADIMQRSVIMELSAIGEGHSSDWNGAMLRRRGGRIGWLAHQLAVLHVFFCRVREEGTSFWDGDYRSKHRLAHFEQLFRAMGTILKVPDLDGLVKRLSESSQNQVSEHDWTMEGLLAFNKVHYPQQRAQPSWKCSLQEVALWASDQSEYSDNQILCNSRRLSRYIKSHAYMVENLAGLKEAKIVGNRQTYNLLLVP